jgi:hypothetical protein
MIDASDRLLADRFARLGIPSDDSDWLDVRRRARRHRRRWLVVLVAAAVGALAVGSAFGLYREVVDFFSAERAPERVVVDFGQMSVRATIGLGPQVVPDEARAIPLEELGGKRGVVYVAPTKDGGFCWRWESGGSCGRTLGLTQRPIGVVALEGPGGGPAQISGHLLDRAIDRLELEYEDGARDEIPFVWVTAPIDAGFFALDVPDEHLRAGHRAQSLLALDRDGRVIARNRFTYPDPGWEREADGLPRFVDRTQKRTLFDFRDESGRRWTLVVAPGPGKRLCYAYDFGGGCISPRFPPIIGGMGVPGGGSPNICCAVAANVATVELRYEDGDRAELEPVDGFLLSVIPREHYRRGHRLEQLVWRDESGREVASRTQPTETPGIYPCAKHEQKDLGYGVKICP